MSRAAEQTSPTCVFCHQAVCGGGGVRLSNGYMHADCHARHWAFVQADFKASLARGTHGPPKLKCDGCGDWCDGYYHSDPFGGKKVCADCADRMFNAGPKAYRQRSRS